MNMTERLLYWVAIIVLIVATFGVKGKVDNLKKQLSQVSQQQPVNGGNQQ
jgi:hypothetical protein